MTDNQRSELPEGWRWVRLGDVCEVVAGQSPPGHTYRKEPQGLPFFQGKADFGDVSPIPQTWCVSPLKVARPGDILISVRAPVGPTNIADVECCIGRGLSAIRTGELAERDYILAALRLYEKRIASLSSGSTFAAIGQEDLRNFEIPLAPRDEQRRIARVLREKLGWVERAREAAEEQLEAINALPGCILRQAFNGDL